jgi:hypothetical protein
MKKLLTPGLMMLLLFACDNPAETNQTPVYFDVAGYVKTQTAALKRQNPTVEKQTRIKEKSQNQTVKNIDWSRELELFTQADINKPAFRNSYDIARPDSLTYRYTLKPSEEKLTVRSLTVLLDAQTRKPRLIEAVLRTQNLLYESERKLMLESGPGADARWQVKQYKLTGFQQLTYFGKNSFFVEGRVQ